MKQENKRIFISDLPETLSKSDLESSFSEYGTVTSVEIKERKELGPINKSLYFAYVSLNTDDKTLNQCFRDFNNGHCQGQRIFLQIARDNFLDRLKREREESKNSTTPKPPQNGTVTFKKEEKVQILPEKVQKSSSESETDSDDEGRAKIPNHQTEKVDDVIFKNNKNKSISDGPLRIPSAGKEPVAKIIDKKKPSLSEANVKRLQSLRDMKKAYQAKKSLIKSALTYGTGKQNNKIIFDLADQPQSEPASNGNVNDKNSLFNNDDSSEESDMEINFEVKEQFEGEAGLKLLELQSRYKNDKRFALNQQFIEDKEDNMKDDVESLSSEKNEQLKILEQVLGKKVTKGPKPTISSKSMLKFDPTQPEHSDLILKVAETKRNKEKKVAKEPESTETEPEVSKQVFYKVDDKLKETLNGKSQFSLLNMFGKEEEKRETISSSKEMERKPSQSIGTPFKYDSSDDENEIEDIPHKSAITLSNSTNKSNGSQPSRSVFWTEPFFFRPDDFRLQEGLDFIEKIKNERKEFGRLRREIKDVVKAKVKNNERKTRMFKKKLGGSKKRKHIRMKRALKR